MFQGHSDKTTLDVVVHGMEVGEQSWLLDYQIYLLSHPRHIQSSDVVVVDTNASTEGSARGKKRPIRQTNEVVLLATPTIVVDLVSFFLLLFSYEIEFSNWSC